jgi:hypothetical protein
VPRSLRQCPDHPAGEPPSTIDLAIDRYAEAALAGDVCRRHLRAVDAILTHSEALAGRDGETSDE